MCGIVGAVTGRNIEKVLLEGIQRLEYRGYDSAGIALLDHQQHLQRLRVQGKVKELDAALAQSHLHGNTAIAHTRWATHGAPAVNNAHPLISHNTFALVHNGIIENHEKLKSFLLKQGYQFSSETDSEVAVHLVHYHYQQQADLLIAVQQTVAQLTGAYALGIISAHHPHRLIAVRHGSPLVIGKGHGENFIASDALALLPVVQQFIYLEDDDIADITRENITVYSSKGVPVVRTVQTLEMSADVANKGTYRHYMSKEIFEQPNAIAHCLENRLSSTQPASDTLFGLPTNSSLQHVKHVHLVACGTSYHAALTARYWLESLAGIPCSVEVASEFRYRSPVIQDHSLFVCLSQSGETADTLAALRLAKNIGFLATLAICNVPESAIVREADLHFMTRAGTEIGVASTKAFTTQLVSLLLLALFLRSCHTPADPLTQTLVSELERLPQLIQETLSIDHAIQQMASQFADKQHALFLGRGTLYPIALEGALKLKEISYIHAEGYPAGELKHGPLALVEKNMPVVILAPTDPLLEKIKSNLHEVRARGGLTYIFTDSKSGIQAVPGIHLICLPCVSTYLSPIVYSIPMQLLAYHVAILKGTDVDQPRNLAKSVTVE